jgi:hypothetical protein
VMYEYFRTQFTKTCISHSAQSCYYSFGIIGLSFRVRDYPAIDPRISVSVSYPGVRIIESQITEPNRR